MRRLAFAILLFLALSGRVAAATRLSLEEPADRTWTEQPLISWGPDQSLRVYTNSRPNGAAVLFMGSGAFLQAPDAIDPGDPELAPFRDRGFAFVVLDYPTGDGVFYQTPNSWDGAVAGLQVAREVLPRYGVDPDRIAVLGTSAGGNLAAYLGLLPSPPRAVGVVDGLLALDSYTTVQPALHFGSMFGAHSQAEWDAIPLQDKQMISPPFLAQFAPADTWKVTVGLYYGNIQGLNLPCTPVHWHDAANGCLHAQALAAFGPAAVLFAADTGSTHAEAFAALAELFEARLFSEPVSDGGAGSAPFPLRLALFEHGAGARLCVANVKSNATVTLEMRPSGYEAAKAGIVGGSTIFDLNLAGLGAPEFARAIEDSNGVIRTSGWLRLDPLR